MIPKNETGKQKYKRLLKLDKTIQKLLKDNHAGMFSVPNPMTKSIQLIIMDTDDLEEFNNQVTKNIEEYNAQKDAKEEEMKKMVTGKGEDLTLKEEKNGATQDISGIPSI